MPLHCSNTPVLEFYRSLGARPLDEWTVQRLAGNDLGRVAAETDRYHPAP
jgi:hypothetical protein